MKEILISVFAFLALFQIGLVAFDEREEAAVYRSVIDKYYIPKRLLAPGFENGPFKIIVISSQTSGYVVPFSFVEKIRELSPKPDEETVRNFLDRNDAHYSKPQLTEKMLRVVGRYPLNRLIRFRLPHALISDAEIDQIFNRGGEWNEFYRRYPFSRGLVFLSRVGFNKNMTQALLYFVQEYDGSAGEGYLTLLAKTKSGWERISQVTVWIS
jgi:hypothetical protein